MLGLAPGGTPGELRDDVAKLGGRLSCKASTTDPRFTECTAAFNDSGSLRWDLRASLVDSTSAVILLKTTASKDELTSLRTTLTKSLGRPNYRQQAGQTSYEWIRAGRMMRLTSRTEKGALQLAVSLVDGAALDALNASR
jgi:hypothetical protein